MTRDEAQGVYVQLLLEKVRQDRYPSWSHMNLIEESLTPAMAPDYLEVLVEKVASDTYPSIPMLRRILRVAQSLPREEPDEG